MLPTIAYWMWVKHQNRKKQQVVENLKWITEQVKLIDTKQMVEDAFRNMELPSWESPY